jgi:simple sugar transport system permease protein
VAAEDGGIRVGRPVILVMLLSGALTGLAGANEVQGVHYRLLDGISPGYGFTAMVVALLGKLHPLASILSAYLFSSLYIGATQMQRVTQVPIALSQVIQGLVVLCILGTDILLDYDFLPLKNLLKRQPPP